MASQELKSVAKRHSFAISSPNQKNSPSPLHLKGQEERRGESSLHLWGDRICPLLEVTVGALVDQTVYSPSFFALEARCFPEQPSTWSWCKTELGDERQPWSMLPAWEDLAKPTSHTADLLRSRLSLHACKERRD